MKVSNLSELKKHLTETKKNIEKSYILLDQVELMRFYNSIEMFFLVQMNFF